MCLRVSFVSLMQPQRLENLVRCMQKARADPYWLSAQEAKLKAFVQDRDAKSLTLANLSKSQADLLSALAPHYGLTTRPMPLLLNKHRLQLLKGAQAVVPAPELVPHAKVLTDEDVSRLQASEAAGTFTMRCACC